MIPYSALVSRAAFEAFCQERAHETYADGYHWAYILGGYDVRVFEDDVSICPWLIKTSYWESWISLAFARACRVGDHVLDVGANVGYYTMLGCDRAGPTGQVVAIEPSAALAHAVSMAITRNGLVEQAYVVGAATWDESGQLHPMFASHTHPINGSLLCAGPDSEGITTVVRTTTIDDVVAGSLGGRVDLIKIDVEGAERHTWRGMQRTLDENPQVVIILEVATCRYGDGARTFYEDIAKRFPLRYVDYAGNPQPVTVDELLAKPDDWMLYLTRRE